MESEEKLEIICPKCNVKLEDGKCPICNMTTDEIEDEEEDYRDWRDRR